jgi:colicin import membrane protein
MKKLLLLLIISIGLVSIYFNYGPSDEKAIDTALAEEEQAAILDAELAKFEAELVTKLALQKEEVEMERQAALDAFQQKLAADKAAAARSTAAYQDSLLEEELAAFEARLEVELAAQEMMAEIETEMQRQVALDAFQQKLAADKAAAAKSTAAYQSKRVNDARVAALMADLALAQELAIFEAKLIAELASQEMMAEIETEMQRQAALDAFQQKLAADKAAAAKSTAAYQSKRVNDARVAALMADLASQEMMVEIKSEMARQIALDSFLKKLADDNASAAASTAAYQATLASDGVDLFLKKLIEIFIR